MLSLLATFLVVLSRVWAEDASPLREAVWTQPLVPVALKLESDGRLGWLDLVFVPTGHRAACDGKKFKECLLEATPHKLRRYAKRRNEPGEVLRVTVGREGTQAEVVLLRALSRAPAVLQLTRRKDAKWGPAGEGVEYPIDRRRVVRAEVRWTLWPKGERLELIRIW